MQSVRLNLAYILPVSRHVHTLADLLAPGPVGFSGVTTGGGGTCTHMTPVPLRVPPHIKFVKTPKNKLPLFGAPQKSLCPPIRDHLVTLLVGFFLGLIAQVEAQSLWGFATGLNTSTRFIVNTL